MLCACTNFANMFVFAVWNALTLVLQGPSSAAQSTAVGGFGHCCHGERGCVRRQHDEVPVISYCAVVCYYPWRWASKFKYRDTAHRLCLDRSLRFKVRADAYRSLCFKDDIYEMAFGAYMNLASTEEGHSAGTP